MKRGGYEEMRREEMKREGEDDRGDEERGDERGEVQVREDEER